ncbi:MAG: 8-oxoguanine DNA glycosylase [Clostridiales Family XIII bacterium]|nr:8-oxoguanine DNA glycosylase [Clostridiales Family XIII bacterium]
MTEGLIKQTFENVSDFTLDHIFDCGQCFRWTKQEDGSYSGIVENSFANISFRQNPIVQSNENNVVGVRPPAGTGSVTIWSNHLANMSLQREKFWRNYLDLDRDYGAVKRLLTTEDDVMVKAIRAGGGIRILNQNKWETLISFIISQNNNIPRIKNCIESLCAIHGKKIGVVHGKPLYAFPTIDCLSNLREKDLDFCRLGYRSKYIVEAARQIAYDNGAFLETGDRMPVEKIEEYLLSLSGVGPKVAHCVMLFSMQKSDIFPIDVWVKRVMNRLYGMGEDNISAMREYAKRNFGAYGGIAQQYLFNYIRVLAVNQPDLYARLGLESEPDEQVFS